MVYSILVALSSNMVEDITTNRLVPIVIRLEWSISIPRTTGEKHSSQLYRNRKSQACEQMAAILKSIKNEYYRNSYKNKNIQSYFHFYLPTRFSGSGKTFHPFPFL